MTKQVDTNCKQDAPSARQKSRPRSLRKAMRDHFRDSGMTKSAAARSIGAVTRQGLHLWLVGEAVPREIYCSNIARWLGLPVAEVREMRAFDLARQGKRRG